MFSPSSQKNKKKWNNIFWYYCDKLSFFSFILFILTLTLERRHIPNLDQAMIGGLTNEWLTISIYISDFFLIGALVLGAHGMHSRLRHTSPTQKILTALLIFCILASSTYSLTDAPAVITYSALKLVSGVLVFLYISSLRSKKHLLAVLASLSFIGAAQSLLGILQFALQNSTGLTILGETTFSPLFTNIAEVTINTIQYIRPPGTFTHANVFGMFLVIAWISSLLYINLSKDNTKEIIHSSRIWVCIFGLTTIPGIFLSFSRSAYLAFGISVLLSLFFIARKEISKSHKYFILSTTTLALVLALILSPIIVPRGTNLESNGDQAISSRISRTEDAIKFIADSPLIGHGAGSYVPESLTRFPDRKPWEYQPVHNYLVTVTEIGLFGSITLISLILSIALKNFKEKNITLYILPIIALTCMVLFDHYYWTIHQGIYLFWITIALTAIISRLRSTRNTK